MLEYLGGLNGPFAFGGGGGAAAAAAGGSDNLSFAQSSSATGAGAGSQSPGIDLNFDRDLFDDSMAIRDHESGSLTYPDTSGKAKAKKIGSSKSRFHSTKTHQPPALIKQLLPQTLSQLPSSSTGHR